MTAVDEGFAEPQAATRPAHRGSDQSFGLLLRRFRAEAQLTQEELADRSGVSVRAIADAESGKTKRPQKRSVQMLADALRLVGPERASLVALSRGQPGSLCELIGPGLSGAADWTAGGRIPVLHQLPPAVAPFVGRQRELAALSDLLGQMRGTAGAVVISAIAGTPGVGKTALAVHWAHQVAGLFADGQLYVNLRGYDPGQPITAADALAGFLGALGVPGREIPAGEDERAARYRSLLAAARMLILLDNACDEQQVRPLLPASPASLVIVTSRSQLAGLAATDGGRLVTLDVLTRSEAVQLLTARLGTARAASETGATDRIAGLCECLPLALAVAAARTAARPGFSLTALAGELAGTAGRLDALESGDPATSVRAVFSWSYRQLGADAARMFRLLGLQPGPDISMAAAASLAARPGHQALRLLGELARAHLITEHFPGRFSFHDLLRAFAAEQALALDDQVERDAAVGRVFDHYLHTAASAAFRLNPAREPVALAPPRPGAAPGQPADNPQAMAWFEAEHQVLLAAVTFAAASGFDIHAWQLPWAMTPFLQPRGHWQESAVTLRTALAAATRLGDIAGQAVCGRLLANADTELGHHEQARGHFASSLTLYQQLGDRFGEAKLLHSLGHATQRQGRYTDALGHYAQALNLYRATGDKASEAEVLNNVAWCHCLLSDYQRARAFCRQALTLFDQVGHRSTEGHAWDSLGYAEHNLGNLTEAAVCYRRALSLHREAGRRLYEAVTLAHLGDTHHAAGQLAQARQVWQQALTIFEDIQHPDSSQVRAKLARTDDHAPSTPAA